MESIKQNLEKNSFENILKFGQKYNISTNLSFDEYINALAEKLFQKATMKSERVPSNVLDKNLYIKARNKVKKRVKVWPSAYASGQLVQEYKKLGGRYSGKKGSKDKAPLDRWYKEKWVNVCKPKGRGYEKCGRKQSKVREYPYCRPSVRVTKQTPMTVSEIVKKDGKEKLQKLCKTKRKEALPKKGKAQRVKSLKRNN